MQSLPTIVITGCPNAGKSALFNRLTGSRQKVANYPGVTVEYKEGAFHTPAGNHVRLIDVPGTYSLLANSPDELVARNVLTGKLAAVGVPDMVILVADATNLKLHLRFALEVKALGIPMILALNMMDIAERRNYRIDAEALSRELGIPVVSTVAVRRGDISALVASIDSELASAHQKPAEIIYSPLSSSELRALQRAATEHLERAGVSYGLPPTTSFAIDKWLMNPAFGLLFLVALMFFIFQAVFTWAAIPMDFIDAQTTALGQWFASILPEEYLRSFIVDGVIAGVGSVIIFLPQILILFFFILLLEDSGYMARAAFLLDKIMGGVGLHGKAFIPLLSSFACAIPGIMATRTIAQPRDRLATILIAPLMTCSARIPVYTLLIAAFIPNQSIHGFNLQGLVMFALYTAGLVAGLLVAWVLKRFMRDEQPQSFIMELPTYKLPSVRTLFIGLIERAKIFLRRAGTIIFVVVIMLWFLITFPTAPEGADNPVLHSFAGMLGTTLAPLFEPIGFNWQMVIALIPAMAAREVAVAALGTVYAISDAGSGIEQSLAEALSGTWSLASAVAFMVWFIFAPQCISTLAVIKRETNSSKWMWVSFGYLTALAYIAAGAAYHLTLAL